jgi:hypothetical protein
MSWNYRVVVKADKQGQDPYFTVTELYYGKNSTLTSILEGDITPMGGTLEELKEDLEHMLEALDKPIVYYKDF